MDHKVAEKADTSSVLREGQSVSTAAEDIPVGPTSPLESDWPALTQELLEWCIDVVDATRQTLAGMRRFKDSLTETEQGKSQPNAGTEPEPADPRDGVFVSFHCAMFHDELAKLNSLFTSPTRIPSYWQGEIEVDVLYTHPIDYERMVQACTHVALANHAHLHPRRFRGSCSMTCAELVVCNFESIQRDLLNISLWSGPGRSTLPTSQEWCGANGESCRRRFLRELSFVEPRLSKLTDARLDGLLVEVRIEFVRTIAWFQEPQVALSAETATALSAGAPLPPRIVVDRQNKTISIGVQVHHLKNDEIAIYLDVLWNERDWMSDAQVNEKLKGILDSAFAGTRWDLKVRKKLAADFPEVFDLLETEQSKGTRFKLKYR